MGDGWMAWLDGRESEWTPGVGDGQGGLACCNSWGHKESDMTEQLNWTEPNWYGAIDIVDLCDTLWSVLIFQMVSDSIMIAGGVVNWTQEGKL